MSSCAAQACSSAACRHREARCSLPICCLALLSLAASFVQKPPVVVPDLIPATLHPLTPCIRRRLPHPLHALENPVPSFRRQVRREVVAEVRHGVDLVPTLLPRRRAAANSAPTTGRCWPRACTWSRPAGELFGYDDVSSPRRAEADARGVERRGLSGRPHAAHGFHRLEVPAGTKGLEPSDAHAADGLWYVGVDDKLAALRLRAERRAFVQQDRGG
jgi:hypothetical protein